MFILVWLGGRTLRRGSRAWTIEGRFPVELGWYSFSVQARSAKLRWSHDVAAPDMESLGHEVRGYLVGDRIVPDGVRVDPDPSQIAEHAEPVALLDPSLPRFVRVVAGRVSEDGPLVYKQQDFPMGPEDAVLEAFLERRAAVDGIPGVVPALDAAFRMESWVRGEVERRRAEIEEERRRQEEQRSVKERRERLARELGTAEGRRRMAVADFGAAAKAALSLGGAEYLDHRRGYREGELIVTFRLLARRFVCSCDARTLRIVDAGICLTDSRTRVKGDTLFTLESLPPVILEAERLRVLHVTPAYRGDNDEVWM